jgi:spore maturation protein CgeB
MKKIVFIDTYYFDVVKKLQIDRFKENGLSYNQKVLEVENFGFGTGASYTRAFRRAGWDAHLVIPNALGLQEAWCREFSKVKPIKFGWKYIQAISRIPALPNALEVLPSFYKVLINQVRAIQPDVIFIQDLHCLNPRLIRRLKKIVPLVYGEIASPLPPSSFLRPYDRIFSALPSIIEIAKSLRLHATYLPLAYDSDFFGVGVAADRKHNVVFVGTFGRHQPKTVPLLQAVADRNPDLEIYGIVDQNILRESGLSRFYKGEIWGQRMFDLLKNSKIVINRHGSIAGEYAVNMRMYETTGSGALLVTEEAVNLDSLFKIDSEVISYTSHDDAAQKISELLNDPQRLNTIAHSGQMRTLTDHTYDHRVKEIIMTIFSDLND